MTCVEVGTERNVAPFEERDACPIAGLGAIDEYRAIALWTAGLTRTAAIATWPERALAKTSGVCIIFTGRVGW